jgi:putative endopeptidase
MISSRLRRAGATLMIFALSVTTFAQGRAFDLSLMDTSVEACDDFYQYANGNWIKNTQIPSDRSRYGTFDIVRERNQNLLRDILETAAKNAKAAPGSNEQLIGDFYASCMDEAAIEAAGLRPLEPLLKQIDNIKDARGLQTVIAALHRQSIPAAFAFGASVDAKNSSLNIASARQGGLSLPNKDYYLDDKFKDVREKFAAYVADMFVLLGEDPARAGADAATVLKIQTRLARASKSRLELRDPEKNYNKIALAEFVKLVPGFDWGAYFAARGAPKFTEINVGQPLFFEELNRMLGDVPAAEWKTYLRWVTLNTVAFVLPKKFGDRRFDFYGRTLGGVKEQPQRWRRCTEETDEVVGEALGEKYVERHYTPAAKKRTEEMIDNLFAAFRERVGQLDWMGAETREKALAKLAAFKRKVGYDESPRGYKGLKIDRKSYADNFARSAQFELARDVQDIGRPVDKKRWDMTPQTVNAGYTAVYNEIIFPAGIMQPPFFDPAADDAINYGAIGFAIGHEITHGFDNRGSRYDAEGNLKSWWAPEDRRKFEEKASCIAAQFGGYEVLPGVNLNGELTLAENIADLGGLTIAYNAFKKALAKNPQPSIDGFTPEQRFFLSYARSFAAKSTPEALKLSVQTDVHSNQRFRVNGVLSNMPQFAEAFGCKAGRPLVRENRCQIW